MATARKISRKDLKKPDDFVQAGSTAVGWVQKNPRTVGGLVALVVVAGVIIVVGAWWIEASRAAAAASLGSALELAGRPILESAEAEGRDDPYFPSEEEKNARVREALEAVRAEHPGTQGAALAALKLGDLALEEGRPDDAVPLYETFIAEAGPQHPFLFGAYEGLALVRKDQGDHEGALAAYERLAAANGFYKPFALVEQARLLQILGRPEDARRRAQQVVDEFPESAAKADAQTVLDGLPPPAAAADAPPPEPEPAPKEG